MRLSIHMYMSSRFGATWPRTLIWWSLSSSRVAFTGGTRQTPLSHNTRGPRQLLISSTRFGALYSQPGGIDVARSLISRHAFGVHIRSGLTTTCQHSAAQNKMTPRRYGPISLRRLLSLVLSRTRRHVPSLRTVVPEVRESRCTDTRSK